MILLKYKTGVRVVIMTCNMRPDDWGGRCQAAWYQGFPFKPPRAKSKGKEKARGKAGTRKRVGADAAPILDEEPEEEEEEEEEEEGGDVGKKKRRGESGAAAADDAGGAGSGGKRKRVASDSEEDYPKEGEGEGEGDHDDVVITSEFEVGEEILIDYFEHVGGPAAVWGRSLFAYDFSSANATLIPSVPGRHKGKDLYRVAFQAASVMNLSLRPYKWLGEITESFMAEKTGGKNGKDGKKAIRDIDVGLAEEEEVRMKTKEQDERNKGKNKPKKPLG
ncbi:unnamed protein product [Ectocarpus sp. CCAP 1310/34]|nr:unnamed protein product [Ectocarpus sp. CCAP 1310/34]